MMAVDSGLTPFINFFLGAAALIGGVGYGLGSFYRGRLSSLRADLSDALKKLDRTQKDLEKSQALLDLATKERDSLRRLIQGPDAPQTKAIVRAIEEARDFVIAALQRKS